MDAISLDTLITVAGAVVLFLTILNQGKSSDAKIDNLRTELRSDMGDLRTELKADIDNLRTELKADIQRVDEKVEQSNNHDIAIRESLAGLTERTENVQRQVDRIESRQAT